MTNLEIEHMRKAEYHRGYLAGQKSKDADHAAVAMRLQRLSFDGGSHESLNKIAYAIYPCATGWTFESCEGLRDRIIDLLGGVHDGVPDCVPCRACGDDCHCGDGQRSEDVSADDTVSCVRADVPAVDGVADSSFTQVTYDELGNERHKAICELRNVPDDIGKSELTYQETEDMIYAALGVKKELLGYYKGLDALRDRLIYLLGGDEPYSNHTRTILEPNLPKSAEIIKSGDEFEDKLMESGENHQIEATFTDELRKFKGRINAVLAPEMVLALRAEINCIADRIDEQERKLRKQRDGFKRAMVAAQDLLEKRMDERDELREEVKSLKRAAGRDADQMEALSAALDDMTMERDELQAKLRTAELGCDANHRLAEANAKWCGELQAKLDAIREALDG